MTTPVNDDKRDEIWYRDISMLYLPSRMIDFFPNKCNNLQENLNSIVRLGIYGSVIVSMYKRDTRYLGWIMVFLLFSYGVNSNYSPQEEHTKETFGHLKTRAKTPKPTINNPFMNPTYLDANKNKEPVEHYYQDTEKAENTRNEVKEKYNYNLYKDIEDVFDRNNSQRQFYTIPSTTIPNDQEAFSNFLFGGMKSCKEDSNECKPYQDLRRNPPILGTSGENPVNN